MTEVSRTWLRVAQAIEFALFIKRWLGSFNPAVSQRELALKAGVQPQHLSKWMQGKVNPRLESRLRIVEALQALEAEEDECSSR